MATAASSSIPPIGAPTASTNRSPCCSIDRSDRTGGWFLINADDEMQTVLRFRPTDRTVEICAINWPQGEVAGKVVLEGGAPPMSGGQPQAKHGTQPDLTGWIGGQPIEGR